MKKAGSLTIKPQKYFTRSSAKLVSGVLISFINIQVHPHFQAVLNEELFWNMEGIQIAFLPWLKVHSKFLHHENDHEDFEKASRLKQLSVNFVGYLWTGSSINLFNIKGAWLLLIFYIKIRIRWWHRFIC